MAALIIVHPGSCMGSADFNLGRQYASVLRRDLTHDVARWPANTPVGVIDGSLSDELAGTPLGQAIEDLVARSAPGVRIRGCDSETFDQRQAARALADKLGLLSGSTVHLTGAWSNSEHPHGGCLGSVRRILEELGCRVIVRDSAFDEMEIEDMGDWDQPDDVETEEGDPESDK